MNSKVLTCLGLLFIIHCGYSAVSILKDSRNPDYPGKCVTTLGQEKVIMTPGDTITDRKSCTRISCSRSYAMNFASCGSIGHPPECHLSKIDETKDYPDCCPHIECPPTSNTL